MKLSLNWLHQHIDVADISHEDLDQTLTFAGVEVEEIETHTIDPKIVVGEIVSSEPHPDADKLSVCQVNHGAEVSQIVCGAKNFAVGDRVPVALPGSVLPGGMKIKKGKLRGVQSLGMLCSSQELGVPSDVDGLWILDKEAPIAEPVQSLVPLDTCFTVEITPNRPDWLSHLGLAREVAAVTGRQLKSQPIVVAETPTTTATPAQIQLDANAACPFYSARIIRGVRVGPSPSWLQERLEAVGLRPINNIVDITNFVLMEMGQPLHAFDLAKLNGGIHVRLAASGEEVVALDGETYGLSAEDTVIADQQSALAIAGVMGGETSGVTESTTDILLESAYFEPAKIRKTSHRLALSSDSSYRFERGVDPQQVLGASELAVKWILELAGGEAESAVQVAGEVPTISGEVELDHAYCREVLGTDVSDAEIQEILSRLGLKGTFNAGISSWEIPSYRLDLQRPIDLVEEVARIYGLDRIPASALAISSLPRAEDTTYDVVMDLKRRLVTLGFCETPTLSMVSQEQIDSGMAGQERPPIPIKNPLGSDYGVMRTTMLAGLASNELSSGLLNVAKRNGNLGADAVRIFEIGSVYSEKKEETLVSLLIAGDSQPVSWMTSRKPRTLNVHDLRGVIEALLPGVALEMELNDNTPMALAAKLLVNLSGNRSQLGVFGQCAPSVAREIGYESVLVAELKLKTVEKLLTQPKKYVEISPYPAITRDVALEIDAALPNQTLGQFFTSYKEPLLERVALFDVFADPSGEKLDVNKKSLAYSLVYRSKTKTLEAKVVDKAHAKLLKALQSNLGVAIR